MKNTNDILKDEIRRLKKSGEGFFAEITGLDIASANRATLDQWLDDGGYSAESILANYREDETGEEETKPTVAPRPVQASQSPTVAIAPPAASQSQAMEMMMRAMEMLSAPAPQSAAITPEMLDELETRILAKVTPVTRVELVNLDGVKKDCGKQHKQFPTLLTLASCRVHTMLVGPAGSFKTTAAEQVAKALDLEFSAISVCQQTSAVSLLGYLNAVGDYVQTEFRKRYELGGVFLLDEIDNGNANVLAVLNSALANGHCAFPDGMIAKHADFILIASGNTFGTGATAQYIGRCQLDAATLDRFAVVQWGYDEGLEQSISDNPLWCARVQAIRKAADKLNSKLVVSPRATFTGGKMIAAGMATDEVERLLIWKGISQAEKEKIISAI